jgi:hypothetical protein
MIPEQSLHWVEENDRVDAYLFSRLSSEETEACRIHLASCETCANIVRREKELIDGIKQYGRSQLKSKIQEHLTQNESSQFEWTRFVSIAATILVMSISVAFFYWMTHEGHERARSREIVMQEHQSALWLIGKVVLKPEPFHGKLTNGAWTFRLQHGNEFCLLHVKKESMESLPQDQKHSLNESENIPSLLERTADGIQLTVYVEGTDHSHLAGVSPTGASAFVLYIEGKQVAYQVPDGWI